MARSSSACARLTACAVMATVFAGVASAAPASNFYQGRTVTILVGSDVGGGYDAYAKALADYWAKYIPGRPSIVVRTMPGAGGVDMQNYLANQAPRDGTFVGATRSSFLVEPLLYGSGVARYDPRAMNWIGDVSGQQSGCFVMKTSAIKTLEDAKRRETRMAQTSALSTGAVVAHVFNELVGTKFKIVSGFSSSGVYRAMARGEIDGSCLSYATVSAAAPQLLEQDKLNFLLVIGTKRAPQLPNVPAVGELLTRPDDLGVVRLIMASLLMGRPYVAPQGVPADRLATLRASFMQAMRDPGFLAEAEERRLIIDPSDHRAIEQLIAAAYKIPAAVVARTRAMLTDAPGGAARSGP